MSDQKQNKPSITLDDIRLDLQGLEGFTLTDGYFYYQDDPPEPAVMVYMYCTRSNETRLYFMQYIPRNKHSNYPMMMGVVHITDANLNPSSVHVYFGTSQIVELRMMLEDKFGMMFPHDSD